MLPKIFTILGLVILGAIGYYIFRGVFSATAQKVEKETSSAVSAVKKPAPTATPTPTLAASLPAITPMPVAAATPVPTPAATAHAFRDGKGGDGLPTTGPGENALGSLVVLALGGVLTQYQILRFRLRQAWRNIFVTD